MIEEPVENSEPQVEGIKANNNSDLRLSYHEPMGQEEESKEQKYT